MKFDLQRFGDYERPSQDTTYRGNRRWSGNFGRVWVDGSLIFEISAFECNVVADREDVIISQSKDSKVVSLTGEGTLTIKRVFDRGFKEYLENLKKGHDVRFTIIAALSDPDMIDAQEQRIQIENVYFNSIPIMKFAKGEVVEDELSFNFTPEDLSYISSVDIAASY